MKFLIAMMAALSLTGCATWPTQTRIEESSFLALHAVDGLQTSQIASTPHVHEAESEWALGPEPSSGRVAAYFAALALAHIAITNYLVTHHAKPWVIRTWEFLGIGWDIGDVMHNASLGIRP